MSTGMNHDEELMARGAARLMDLFIRAGLVLALVLLCYRIFSPFLTLMIWALILAVTLFPLQQLIARRIGGRQGLASTLVVLMGFALIVTPTAVLMNSMADSIHQLINDVQDNTLEVPAPRAGVAQWPLVGERLHAAWTRAHDDLPAFVQSLQPKIGDIAKSALGFVAGIGVGLLMFLAAFVVAGIFMAYGQAGSRGSRAVFDRIVGPGRGAAFTRVSTATSPAVPQGGGGVAV
ncbi:MAG: AI-2E family transporter, partial [Rhodospirillales bacterium]|nr:AI-2E family transporter [Rhodospirillales bacterium]